MNRNYKAMAAEGRSRIRYIFNDPVFDDVMALKQPLRAERRSAGPLPWTTWPDEFRDRWNPASTEPLRLTIAADALDGAPELCKRILGLGRSDNLDAVVSPFTQSLPIARVTPFSLEQQEGFYWSLVISTKDEERHYGVYASLTCWRRSASSRLTMDR